ncbi:hypothetical protein TrVE_jg8942 [Triparma verrucosa]|uniref:Uncharacterized protein n=2 Tax=Triparma TaxID=722752 RepID=A0A9W7BTI3_9STRA|nr:hypothetical protein TrVE_jg8942 [Triparma verrucosa]GMH92170.1 hypothetical protein TrST_g6604 [Triparma strigata]
MTVEVATSPSPTPSPTPSKEDFCEEASDCPTDSDHYCGYHCIENQCLNWCQDQAPGVTTATTAAPTASTTTSAPTTAPTSYPTITISSAPTNTTLLNTAESPSSLSTNDSTIIIGASLGVLGFVALLSIMRGRRPRTTRSRARTAPPRRKGLADDKTIGTISTTNSFDIVEDAYDDDYCEPLPSFASSTDVTAFTDMLPILAGVPLACPNCEGAPVAITTCATCSESHFIKV